MSIAPITATEPRHRLSTRLVIHRVECAALVAELDAAAIEISQEFDDLHPRSKAAAIKLCHAMAALRNRLLK